MTVADHGAWRSVISADDLVHGLHELSYVDRVGTRTYWVESVRATAGATLLMYADDAGVPAQALPSGRSARSDVYGYGAGPYCVHHETVFFVDAVDQGLHRYDPGGEPRALTPDAIVPTRYAAPAASPDGRHLYCVRERVLADDTVHDLVCVPTDGSGVVTVLAEGHDFYGAPALSPDGRRLAFVTWDHPHMAWDESTLWEVRLADPATASGQRRVGGGPRRSFTQPRYGPDGRLHVVHDGTGWWNLYVERGSAGKADPFVALAPMAAEFGRPDWFCGLSTYGFLDDGSVVAAARSQGVDTLVRITPDGSVATTPGAFTVIDSLAAAGTTVAMICASPGLAPAVALLPAADPDIQVVRRSRPHPVGREWVSTPERIEFPTEAGLTAHALYYPPRNPDFSAPDGVLPPLIVSCHGGPTVMSTGALNYGVQFWTSRGFAVVEVNYGGSPGYGRAYRERIRGRWGITDVEDCVNAARHLVAAGAADPRRLIVRGLSSGGYTALHAALRASDFAVVTSYFGVVDPATIPGRTHKMESRYLDGLIGAWPEERGEYERRSVLRHAADLRTPTLLFHGLKDPIVPADQSERLRLALAEQGVPVRHVTYQDEGHGFARPENVIRTATEELRFLGELLGFVPAAGGTDQLVTP
ncbi:S9 family peptidase [Nonomuraea typhae]|uniref:S9 family peptidase n=1 Tax=Nonomuraea typhae TaxID=2603600 RepID=A0ABW7Z9K9_9ACTN